MKSSLIKAAAIGTLSLIAMSSVYANWQCRMHNARGQTFYGVGNYRNTAASNAMMACSRKVNTSYAQNCKLDFCRAGNYSGGGVPIPPAGPGNWYCNIANKAGGTWTAYGVSRAEASAAAMLRCAGRGNSAYARNCTITYCGRR